MKITADGRQILPFLHGRSVEFLFFFGRWGRGSSKFNIAAKIRKISS